jgi:hypothetical protein
MVEGEEVSGYGDVDDRSEIKDQIKRVDHFDMDTISVYLRDLSYDPDRTHGPENYDAPYEKI